jgi:hypothetical protein
MSDEYPPEKRQRRYDGQRWIYSVYQSAVLQMVRGSPGLNVKQMAAKLPESLRNVKDSLRKQHATLPAGPTYDDLRKRLDRFPDPGPGQSRRTVRKHLKDLLSLGLVTKIGIEYYATEPIQSSQLDERVSKSLTEGTHYDWFFPSQASLGLCRISVDPPQYLHRFDDLFNAQLQRLTRKLFFFDDILVDGIGKGFFSRRTFQKNSLKLDLLKEGWTKYFQDTKMVVLSVALSPSDFVKFLTTASGLDLANRILDRQWLDIVDQAETIRKLKHRQDAIIEKLEKERELQ